MLLKIYEPWHRKAQCKEQAWLRHVTRVGVCLEDQSERRAAGRWLVWANRIADSFFFNWLISTLVVHSLMPNINYNNILLLLVTFRTFQILCTSQEVLCVLNIVHL